MPTFETAGDSWPRAYSALTPEEKKAFKAAVRKFVEDLKSGNGFRKGLRVKGVKGMPGCFEMTWANDGRAIFCYGQEVVPGDTHVVWLAIGGHKILP